MNEQAAKIKQQNIALVTIPLGFIVVCGLIQIFDGRQWANLHVAATLNGEYWRILTSHLIHFDWPHYGMNMIGLSLCVAVFYKDMHPKHWILSFIALSLFSSAGLLMIYSPQDSYVGFSDVLHGWIMLGCTAIYPKEKKLAITVFVLFWIKIIEENMSLPFFTSFGVSGNVAKESHILGALSGLLYGLIFLKPFKKQELQP